METYMKSLLLLIPTGLLVSSMALAGPWGPVGAGQSPAAAGLAAAGYTAGSSPGAGYVAHGDLSSGVAPHTGSRVTLSPKEERKLRALSTLRDEGLKLQKADGGKLTSEHYAYLQGKLDAINAKYR
jgi:hypothetical protein